jgi:uncharacterized membrane protein YphA (DoxX/SURF4 family)
VSAIGAAAGVAVGAALLAAGAAKLARPAWVRDAAALGVPNWLARPVPVVELAVGAGLVTGVARRPLAWVALALLVAFSALLARSVAAGRRPVCACFGGWSAKPIGPGALVRNGALAVLSLVAALAG